MIADSYAGALTLGSEHGSCMLGLACLAISATRKVVAVFRFDPSAIHPYRPVPVKRRGALRHPSAKHVVTVKR